MSSYRKYTEEEELALADRVNAAFNNAAALPVIVPNCVARGIGRMPDTAAGKQPLSSLDKNVKKKAAPAKKTAAPTKKKVAAASTCTKKTNKQNANSCSDKKSWPKVKMGHWDYVYICGGPFAGRFGYYDDHEKHALVYFGRPLTGDGPYDVPLRYLRDPPASVKQNAEFSPW